MLCVCVCVCSCRVSNLYSGNYIQVTYNASSKVLATVPHLCAFLFRSCSSFCIQNWSRHTYNFDNIEYLSISTVAATARNKDAELATIEVLQERKKRKAKSKRKILDTGRTQLCQIFVLGTVLTAENKITEIDNLFVISI